MLKVLAKVDFRRNDNEFERLYNEYRAAKGALVAYLQNEGFDWTLTEADVKEKPVSGN